MFFINNNASSQVRVALVVDRNDIVMASRAEVIAFSADVKRFTRAIPSICLEIFLNQSQQSNKSDISQTIQRMYFNDSQHLPQFRDVINLTDLVTISRNELNAHMEECGTAADPIVDRLLNSSLEAYQNIPGNLTFNWIRCFDGPREKVNITDLRPDAQKEFYQSVWTTHQRKLYNQYLEEETEGIDRIQDLNSALNETAQFRAFNRSIHEATGGTGCHFNTPASGKSVRMSSPNSIRNYSF